MSNSGPHTYVCTYVLDLSIRGGRNLDYTIISLYSIDNYLDLKDNAYAKIIGIRTYVYRMFLSVLAFHYLLLFYVAIHK